jgi:hypothetical protein
MSTVDLAPIPTSSLEEVDFPFVLPFPSKLSLQPLIEYITAIADNGHGSAFFAKEILKRLEAVPALKAPIEDLSLISEHQPLVDMMLTMILSTHIADQNLIKISGPFSKDELYVSPRLKKMFAKNDVRYELSKTNNILFCATLVKACSLILNKFYGQDIEIDPPLQVTVQQSEEELPHFYKASMDFSFLDIRLKGELPLLKQKDIDELLSNIYDSHKWLQAFPVDKFEFHGFVIVSMNDITSEEALSRIKHHLLRRDAILDQENVQELEQLMRIYLGVPDLRLGVTAIDFPLDRAVSHKYKIRFDLLSKEVPDLLDEAYSGSIYQRVCQYRENMLVENINALKNKTELERKLMAQGIQSIIVSTLVDNEDNVIGLVELASPKSYGLHSFIELKFREIVSLFHTAVLRSREEVDNIIEAIIREQYTALHSSVEWRFIEESYEIMDARSKGNNRAKGQSIVFNDVHPLYGQADIVSSSLKRNESIRADLIAELNAARTVLEDAKKIVRFPLIDQTILHLDRELKHLNDNYNSSDETRIIELIQREIQPLLKQLGRENKQMAPAVDRYFALLDPNLGIIYNKRKDYEISVESVNTMIGNYLDSENAKMQQTLPHYFERYKTDGVEYNIYIGHSLLKKKNVFSDIHLRNFRLWQLIQMCEITRQVEENRHFWPEPLTTAQLIFAYTNSLSIKFRMDEKRFDVDGAYNVRYEILKKRIDKAVIEGTEERITQSGYVSVIYLQEKDREEYLQYADYLLHHGYISEPPRDYELAALQGVHGLRALRLKVKY